MSIIYKRLNFNIQEIIDKKLLIRNTKGQAEQIENDLFKYVLYEELDKHLIKKEHTNKFLKWFCFEVINKVINNNMYSLKDMKLKTIKNQVLNLKKCYYNNNNSSSCYIIEDIIEKIEFLIREFISSNISIKLFQDNIDINEKNKELEKYITFINELSNTFNLDIPFYKDSNGDYIFIKKPVEHFKEHRTIINNFVSQILISKF
tara:strand:- start:1799 stop:2410 length:612 start_codon:yes stop_codon:yes gene_type:complete